MYYIVKIKNGNNGLSKPLIEAIIDYGLFDTEDMVKAKVGLLNSEIFVNGKWLDYYYAPNSVYYDFASLDSSSLL